MKLLDLEESQALLRRATTIAVLGIKPESEGERAAHWIPSYLAYVGYTILPVPVGYPGVAEILGQPVVATLSDLNEPPDIVNVFRRPEHVPAHLDDIRRSGTNVVWFQSVCMNEAAAAQLHAGGLDIVCSCIGCTRATIHPSYEPLG